jgi:hypothetical protein
MKKCKFKINEKCELGYTDCSYKKCIYYQSIGVSEPKAEGLSELWDKYCDGVETGTGIHEFMEKEHFIKALTAERERIFRIINHEKNVC